MTTAYGIDFRRCTDELAGRTDHDPGQPRLRSLWEALKEAANPKDLKAYLHEMFEKHSGTINDVLQSDDPAPALGVLFPVALALRQGEISMSVLAGGKRTGVPAAATSIPRPDLSPQLAHRLANGIALCAVRLRGQRGITRDNVGWIIGLPMRIG